MRGKIKIICPEHGIFRQVANSHLLGHGCRHCHYEKMRGYFRYYNQVRVTRASKNYIERARGVHPNRNYDYSLTEYKKGTEKITVICPEHGRFKPTANNHLAGQICPECSDGGFNPKKPATMYYLKIKESDLLLYKIGITNKKMENRYSSPSDRGKIEIIKRWEYESGFEAQQKEKEIKKAHHDFVYHGKSPLLRVGTTEIFNYDILGLDNTQRLRSGEV